MEESKLTMLQRQKINYALRSGDSLPTLNEKIMQRNKKLQAMEGNSRPVSPKRRMYNTIVKSGAYEREKYVPKHPIEDRNKSIERLQNIMYYGKDIKKKPGKSVKKKLEKQMPLLQEMTFEERNISTS